MERYYAGIGSRKTPISIQHLMYRMARQLNSMGYTLRSGHADGADKACESGSNKSEIFVPWINFNHSMTAYLPHHRVPNWTPEMINIAAAFHPAWGRCSEGAKKLHTRNVCQILGEDLLTPVEFVLCWTLHGLGQGGTGQALRIAHHHNIPVFDLGKEGDEERFVQYLKAKEKELAS